MSRTKPEDCPRFASGGCKFEARYDDVPPPVNTDPFLRVQEAIFRRDGVPYPKRYVRDVCVRCGETVERKPETK